MAYTCYIRQLFAFLNMHGTSEVVNASCEFQPLIFSKLAQKLSAKLQTNLSRPYDVPKIKLVFDSYLFLGILP